jgi:hypothetical protein
MYYTKEELAMRSCKTTYPIESLPEFVYVERDTISGSSRGGAYKGRIVWGGVLTPDDHEEVIRRCKEIDEKLG